MVADAVNEISGLRGWSSLLLFRLVTLVPGLKRGKLDHPTNLRRLFGSCPWSQSDRRR